MDERDLHYLKKETKLNGRYIITSVLGEGGFGITYYGVDDLFGNEVAIKEFFPQGIVTRNNEYTDNVTVTYAKQDEAFLAGKKRFIGEARVMAKFNGDQGIVNVTDFFEANNTAYIVMEYLDGITLKEYLKGNRQIPVDELMGLLAPLLESLDDVHQSGLIHRDISPDNIMVLKDGSVKLMDFGAARDYTEFGEKSLSIVLKPGYAPAEQYQSRGVQGPWTDIYALCATIYKCITGKTPEDSIQRVMEDELKKPSELGVDISPQIEKTLLKGMSIAPKDRYQNLKDLCEDLYKDYMEEEESLEESQKETEVEPAETLEKSSAESQETSKESQEIFEEESEALKKEKKELLLSITNDENYLLPKYDCNLCNDTGYITENYKTQMCQCLKQQLYNIEYNKSNISSGFSTYDNNRCIIIKSYFPLHSSLNVSPKNSSVHSLISLFLYIFLYM